MHKPKNVIIDNTEESLEAAMLGEEYIPKYDVLPEDGYFTAMLLAEHLDETCHESPYFMYPHAEV